MKKPFLNDFENWKKLNNDFSLFDYLFQITKKKEFNSDIIFAFLDLFWPSFVVYNEYVFLKNNFSAEKVKNLINEKQNVEYWVNLLVVDPYFENEENSEEESEFFAKSLVQIWQTKLKNDFPLKKIVVEYVFDSECGDYGLTFHQINKMK